MTIELNNHTNIDKTIKQDSLPQLRSDTPFVVLELILSKIEMDGTVMFYDDSQNKWFPVRPYEPVDLERFPNEIYASHLLATAKCIYTHCRYERTNTLSWSISTDSLLRNTAHFFTQYMHDHAFLEEAASLIQVTDRGWITFPYMGHTYVPQRRRTQP
jgi:hypothetical protein